MCIVGCAALSMGSCGSAPGGDSPVRNIVLITLDTLRADHLHCYGYERETSAGIDSLAAAGVRFHRAYAPISSTGPSHASLFTGLYPGSDCSAAYTSPKPPSPIFSRIR